MKVAAAVWLTLVMATSVFAQVAKPADGKRLEAAPPSRATRADDQQEAGEQKLAQPEVTPPPQGPLAARSARPPSRPGTGAAPIEGALKGARALPSPPGTLRLLFPDGERTLRPGDRLGSDVVRTAADGLLVLDRPPIASRTGGGATVVVRFDAGGQPRMRVYHVEDPTPVNPPEVR